MCLGLEGPHTVYVTSECKFAVSVFLVCNSVCGLFSVRDSDMDNGFDVMVYMLGLSN